MSWGGGRRDMGGASRACLDLALALALWYRLLRIMDMVASRTNTETHGRGLIHNPQNGLSFWEGKASLRPRGWFELVSPKATPHDQHRYEIQQRQVHHEECACSHWSSPYTIVPLKRVDAIVW
jgi:hypothetical protein